eukprot:gene5365-3860_t
MPPKREAQADPNSREIAQVSAASVDGYLRNVAHRQRVPRAEGGKGTRRKVAMVTSTAIAAAKTEEASPQPAPKPEPKPEAETEVGGTTTIAVPSDGDSEGDEWDEVELPGMTAPKAEVKSAPSTSADAGVKPEPNQQTGAPAPASPRDSLFGNCAPPLSRPSGVDEFGSATTAWGRSDPAYEEMRARQDQLTAQRRSERMQRIFSAVVELAAVLVRGEFLWRQARHPRLLRCLLRLRRGERFPLLDAVTEAKPIAARGRDPARSKPCLTPVWVTAQQDGAKNNTSEAVAVLLHAIHEWFRIEVPTNDSEEAQADSAHPVGFSRWSVPLPPHLLFSAVRQSGERIRLPHPVYICVVALSLCAMASLDARLVVAKECPRAAEKAAETHEKLSIFAKNRVARPTRGKDVPPPRPRQPVSCFWLEVWSPERQSFISVNPCPGVTTLWGAPYAFSVGRGAVVDTTARYTSSLSRSYLLSQRLGRCTKYRFMWKDCVTWDDTREVSDVLIAAAAAGRRCPDALQRERETRQLESLRYSEKVPTTLAQLHHHPLFVIESDVMRMEGIYPKDKFHTVGSVKGHTVYKRSAVQSLRSRDGWIRERRSIQSGEEPYKVVAPPASRPFASPSQLFGFWQTVPFAPQPLAEDGSLPQHGNTRWYILLSHAPPAGISHRREPNIARVARRMQLDFRLAVIGFVHKQIQVNRRGLWSPDVDGIVVRVQDEPALLKAYQQWVKKTEEQAAARRRDRAFHWWMLLSQRLLAVDRLNTMYAQGQSHAYFCCCSHTKKPRLASPSPSSASRSGEIDLFNDMHRAANALTNPLKY